MQAYIPGRRPQSAQRESPNALLAVRPRAPSSLESRAKKLRLDSPSKKGASDAEVCALPVVRPRGVMTVNVLGVACVCVCLCVCARVFASLRRFMSVAASLRAQLLT